METCFIVLYCPLLSPLVVMITMLYAISVTFPICPLVFNSQVISLFSWRFISIQGHRFKETVLLLDSITPFVVFPFFMHETAIWLWITSLFPRPYSHVSLQRYQALSTGCIRLGLGVGGQGVACSCPYMFAYCILERLDIGDSLGRYTQCSRIMALLSGTGFISASLVQTAYDTEPNCSSDVSY